MAEPIPQARVREALAAWRLEGAELSVLPAGASGDVFRVAAGGRTLVAKYAYMARRDFEPGLLAAEAVSGVGLAAAAPVRTDDGELVVMIEWPDGVPHPLAVLEWVEGSPVDPTTRSGAARVGATLGTVQARLLGLSVDHLVLQPPRDYLAYLRTTDQDLGSYAWLHEFNAGLVAEIEATTASGGLTVGPGVWDGPEIVIDDRGTIGLIDFGNVDVHPVAHALGYGTTQVSRPGRTNPENERIFLDAFAAECPVTDQDVAAIPCFRKATLAIYAKFMTTRRLTGRLPPELDDGLDRTLAELSS